MDNPLPHAISILSSTPSRWNELAQHASLDLLTLSPKTGEWSAFECLLHLLDTERWVFPVRVQAFLSGQDFPAFNPDTQGTGFTTEIDFSGLTNEFQLLRQSSLALLETLVPSDLNRTARHAELGPVSLGQLLNEWAAHDLDHTIQAERALMQPFIRGCGPWQTYFASNLIP